MPAPFFLSFRKIKYALTLKSLAYEHPPDELANGRIT